MSLTVTRIFADDEGETHLADIVVPTEGGSGHSGTARAELPTTTMIYVEYPPGEIEIIPGYHCAPRRQLVLCLSGGFEVTTTSGDSRVFRPGDWMLADDLDSKGHLTRGVGEEPRKVMAVGLAGEWSLPEGRLPSAL